MTRTPIEGASDHGISEAIYLPDPDGNGIELAADRPREAWPTLETLGRPNPLDLYGLLGRSATPSPSAHADPGTIVGHVHLHVNDIAAARRFYEDVVGFAADDRDAERGLRVGRRLPPPPRLQHLARRRHPGAPAPETVAGLRHWTILVDGAEELAAARERRLEAAGVGIADARRRPARPRPRRDPGAARARPAVSGPAAATPAAPPAAGRANGPRDGRASS